MRSQVNFPGFERFDAGQLADAKVYGNRGAGIEGPVLFTSSYTKRLLPLSYGWGLWLAR